MITYAIQLLTPNNLDRTHEDVSVRRTFEALARYVIALYKSTFYLFTYLLNVRVREREREWDEMGKKQRIVTELYTMLCCGVFVKLRSYFRPSLTLTVMMLCNS